MNKKGKYVVAEIFPDGHESELILNQYRCRSNNWHECDEFIQKHEKKLPEGHELHIQEIVWENGM